MRIALIFELQFYARHGKQSENNTHYCLSTSSRQGCHFTVVNQSLFINFIILATYPRLKAAGSKRKLARAQSLRALAL